MPIDQTQPSKPRRTPEADHLAETDKHLTRADIAQAKYLESTRQTKEDKLRPEPPPQKRKKKNKYVTFLLVAFSFFGGLVLLGVFSGALGYYNGNRIHASQATLEMETYLNDQLRMAAEDYVAGNYLLARDRLVYILENNRDFSAAIELLIEVQVVLNMTATPPAPTSTTTMTPTPDLRPAEEQYNTALSMISLAEWDLALETLSNIRKTNPSYRIIDVDGLIYLALRNRGVDKILNHGELEGGIYDFSLAENFGPLDNESNNYRTWARAYLLGNAFWGAYPEQAAYWYGQVVSAGVNITDASGVSAFYRYWASLAQMGDFSAKEGDWCLASEQYQVALNSWALNQLFPTATHAFERCLALTPSATPTATLTATFDPLTLTALASETIPGSTATFTLTATKTQTATPTFTPTTGGAPVNTNTPTPTPTPTPTKTPTPTPTPTNTTNPSP